MRFTLIVCFAVAVLSSGAFAAPIMLDSELETREVMPFEDNVARDDVVDRRALDWVSAALPLIGRS